MGIETAFIASYKGVKPGPVVAFLAEYDALKGLGHACGHHLICVMSTGATVGLKSVIDEIGGKFGYMAHLPKKPGGKGSYGSCRFV